MGNSPQNHFDSLGHFAHQHDCNQEQIEKIKKAESEAKRRLSLWNRFLKKIPGRLEIADHLESIGTPNQGDFELIERFTRLLRIKMKQIDEGFTKNEYGVECECSCKEGDVAYVIRNWVWLGLDDDIHFCPEFFKLSENERAADFLHEMSHYFTGTNDDYGWTQPSSDLLDSLQHAQIFEEAARIGKTSKKVQDIYWSWITDSFRDGHEK